MQNLEEQKLCLSFDYTLIPWFDRDISYSLEENCVSLRMTDKKGQNEHLFAIGGMGKDNAFVLLPTEGKEEELEWYRRKLEKWLKINAGKKCWYDWFGHVFKWAETKPSEEFEECPIFLDNYSFDGILHG